MFRLPSNTSQFTLPGSADRQSEPSFRTTSLSRLIWLAGVCLLLISLPGGSQAQSASGLRPVKYSELITGGRVYLPLITNASDFALNQPIWPSASTPQPHEVALFRLSFNLSQSLAQVELQLFADTRYQAWIDGYFIGRGPARFARTFRQYDVYTLASLAPGDHTLAVLVQWSPDDRRAESVRPLLQGSLQGMLPDGSPFIIRTSSAWQSQLSPAWRSDAALIHAWGLIGYSELLDLSQLPADWNQPAYSAAGWPQAVVVDPYQQTASLSTWQSVIDSTNPQPVQSDLVEPLTSIRYAPRDIAFPVNTAIPVTLIDAGALLPGREIAELAAGTPAGISLPFTAT